MKFFENKWAKWLIVIGLSFAMLVANIFVGVQAQEGQYGTFGFGMGALLIFVALPVFYFPCVLLNYLRFKITKLLRWLICVAAMLLAVIALISIIVSYFEKGFDRVTEAGVGQVYCMGFSTGSLITFTLLFFDFEKMGYNPEFAEKRTGLENIIIWSIMFIAPSVLLGFLFMIVRAINQAWLYVVVFVVLMLFTVVAVARSIHQYGLPLGSSKEWKEYLDKQPSYSYSSSSSASFGSDDNEGKEVDDSAAYVIATAIESNIGVALTPSSGLHGKALGNTVYIDGVLSLWHASELNRVSDGISHGLEVAKGRLAGKGYKSFTVDVSGIEIRADAGE